MKKADSAHPAPIIVPVRLAEKPAGTPAQQAFRQAVQDVENLRERLHDLRAEQAEARRRYWQQVGPAATAVVTARRGLFPALEEALLLGYFSRMEETQITELILGNARSLENRFGEDEGVIIRKYAPAGRPNAAAAAQHAQPVASAQAEYLPDPSLLPHEQAAAAAKARRKTKAQRTQEAAEQADQKSLASNAKTIYRQLARTHHPDLERDPEKQVGKTAQMQRITAAYEADDLYTLLQLLAESGPADADADADDVLVRYTRALLQQQITLKQEMNEVKYGAAGYVTTSGKKQALETRQLKRDLRAEAEYVEHVGRLIREADGLRDVLRQLAAEGLGSL